MKEILQQLLDHESLSRRAGQRDSYQDAIGRV